MTAGLFFITAYFCTTFAAVALLEIKLQVPIKVLREVSFNFLIISIFIPLIANISKAGKKNKI